MRKYTQLLALPVLTVLLAACGFSFASDVTPPPGANLPAETKPATETTTKIIYPLVIPSAEKGEEIYEENCVLCHGQAGLGDGSHASQLPNAVPPIGTASVVRKASPDDWFKIITTGKMEGSMPAFRSLTDRQRWDVIAYVYSLSTSADTISHGEKVYRERCFSCHGEKGAGDGPQAASLEEKPQNLHDLSFAAKKSNLDYYTAIKDGVEPSMPAYADDFDETTLWALVDYLRSMTFKIAKAAPSEEDQHAEADGTTMESTNTVNEDLQKTSATLATPLSVEANSAVTETITQTLGTISGAVIETGGGEVPPGTEIILHAFDKVQQVYTTTTQLMDDGTYLFSDVEMPIGRTFVTTVEYQGATYGSRIVTIQQETDALDMPIQVYETTTDTAKVSTDRLHLFFDFIDEHTLQVGELYIISNNSGKTLVPPEEGESTLKFYVPEEAVNLQTENGSIGDRFIATDTGFADTIPLYPGSGNYQMMYSFEIPYDKKLVLELPLELRTDAVVILVPENGLKIKGDKIQDIGTRDAQGVVYHMYSAGNFSPGDVLTLTITGKIHTGVDLATDNQNNLLIGAGALALALIVAGVWMFQRNKRINQESEDEKCDEYISESSTAEEIMDAILALDDLFEAGEIPEEAFIERRQALKARLREALAEEQPAASSKTEADSDTASHT